MDKKKTIHFIIAIVIGVLVKFLLPVNELGLTTAGASTLAIFIATIYCWLAVDVSWVSYLSVGLLVFTGITTSANIWASSWGSSLVMLIIATTLLSYAVNKTGIAKLIATWFITRKAVVGHPYTFLMFFGIANLLVGWVMDATPTTIIFGLIAANILEELGYGKDDKFAKCMFLIVFWVTNFGYFGTPICHPIPLVVLGLMEASIGPVSYLKYMLVGIPFSIILFVATLLILRFVVKPDTSLFEKYDVEARRKELKPLTAQGKFVAVLYILVIFFWLAPDIVPGILPGFAAVLKNIGNVIPPLIAVVLLCIINIDGEPCMNFGAAMKEVPWGVLAFISAIMCYTTVLGLESGGIKVFLTNLVAPLANSLSSTGLVAVALLIGLVLTNFMSNGVAATIVWAAFSSAIIANIGLPYQYAFGVVLAMFVNTAFMTPSANAVAPLVFQHGYLNTSDALKYGTVIIVVAYALGMALIYPLAGMIFA